MAENQDVARPRILGGFGHFFRRYLRRLAPNIGLALGVMCAAAVLPGSVLAQDIGLRRGEASLNAGEFTVAARQLSATVNDKDATINQVARALYLRGIAYRRAGYPGQAAADLGAALWLGLPSSDKARAYVNKGLAFQAAGMESQGASAMAQARRYSSASTVQKLIAQDGGVGPVASAGIASYIPDAGSMWDSVVPSFGTRKTAAQPQGAAAPAEQKSVWERMVPSFGAQGTSAQSATASAPEGASSAAAAAPQAAPTSGWDASVREGSGGNAVTRWWDSLGSGGTQSAQTAPAPSAASAPAANTTTATRSAPTPQAAQTSGGSGGSGIGGWFSRQTAALTGAGAASSAASGRGYTVQLANSSSRSEAEAQWAKAKRSNSSLASAPSRVETINMGSLGTFYTIKIGPFASKNEGSKVCNSIKRVGTDCTVVASGG
jgi:hypothetical protein